MSNNHNHLVAGYLLVALGLLEGVLIYLHPEQLNVPAAVAYAACLVFAFAGLAIITKALGLNRFNAWLVVAIVAIMLVSESWIAFGPGPRRCSVSIHFFRSMAPDLMCRGAFVLGTILVALMLAWAIRSAYRTSAWTARRRGGH